MNIGELARLSGVTASRIRFYEREGLLRRAMRGQNGYRVYQSHDLKLVGFIERAQRLGFSLKEIGSFMTIKAAKRASSRTVLDHLEAKLAEIDAHMIEARRRRSEIVKLMAEIRSRRNAPRS